MPMLPDPRPGKDLLVKDRGLIGPRNGAKILECGPLRTTSQPCSPVTAMSPHPRVTFDLSHGTIFNSICLLLAPGIPTGVLPCTLINAVKRWPRSASCCSKNRKPSPDLAALANPKTAKAPSQTPSQENPRRRSPARKPNRSVPPYPFPLKMPSSWSGKET